MKFLGWTIIKTEELNCLEIDRDHQKAMHEGELKITKILQEKIRKLEELKDKK